MHSCIRASKGWVPLDLKELWLHRELLYFLTWRDIKVRYKQSVMGIAWAVMVPLTTMVVFNLIFGLLSDRKPAPDGVPYAISTLCAMAPWQLFAQSVNQSTNSLTANRNLITKVYFPRLIIPVAPVLAALVDFAIVFGLLTVMALGFRLFSADAVFHLSWTLLALPLFVLFAVMASLAASLWLSALNAIYRDIRHMVPFVISMMMFVSPVVFDSQSLFRSGKLPAWVETLYWINPMASVIEGFRWALLGKGVTPHPLMFLSVGMMLVMLVGGLFFFRRMERSFVDVA